MMETVWFMMVALTLAGYAVLDGFDLGAGAIYLAASNSPEDRRKILRAIGPVWDGNEVWLLAAGGTLYFAFPALYASSFSGFYLPLMMVLWLLMLRGIGIELRSHIENRVWVGFFDLIFGVSSILLAIFFGVALGNVIRGVPLGADGYFFEPLWTDFRVGPNNGILDWYTILTGIVALVTLIAHGSLYVAVKTDGSLNERMRGVARRACFLQVILTVVSLIATCYVQPVVLNNYKTHSAAYLIPAIVFGSLATMIYAIRKSEDKLAFVASAFYIVSILAGAAFALYPVVLPASTDSVHRSLTIYNAAADHYGLSVGLMWWIPGMILALGYSALLFRLFRGKVRLEDEGY
jgi:cytochrome d ubiquinol oxidase subunit II